MSSTDRRSGSLPSRVGRHALGSLAGGAGAGLLVALATLLTNLMQGSASPIGDLLVGFGVLWLICGTVYGVWIFLAAGPAAWLLRRLGRTGALVSALAGAVLALGASEATYALLQFVPSEAPSQRLLFIAVVMASGAVAALIYRRIVRVPA